jgi:hypothetical protein
MLLLAYTALDKHSHAVPTSAMSSLCTDLIMTTLGHHAGPSAVQLVMCRPGLAQEPQLRLGLRGPKLSKRLGWAETETPGTAGTGSARLKPRPCS